MSEENREYLEQMTKGELIETIEGLERELQNAFALLDDREKELDQANTYIEQLEDSLGII